VAFSTLTRVQNGLPEIKIMEGILILILFLITHKSNNFSETLFQLLQQLAQIKEQVNIIILSILNLHKREKLNYLTLTQQVFGSCTSVALQALVQFD